MTALNRDFNKFFTAVETVYGENFDIITRPQINDLADKLSIVRPYWITNDPDARAGRGLYSLNVIRNKYSNSVIMTSDPKPQIAVATVEEKSVPVVETSVEIQKNPTTEVAMITERSGSYIPTAFPGYVPFGHYNDIRTIIRSKKFYTAFVTGLSGNGKTLMVEQACVAEKRECIRVNITRETDEEDLIGGFRLIDGNTVWQNGPVITAMERGAILLLDEVDLGDAKMMCLQPILEGNPVFVKKINRLIMPSNGFNIIATANTKGQGSDDGKFIGTNVLNEAFLERFSVTFDQEYPGVSTETKILEGVLKLNGLEAGEFVKTLVNWSDIVRKTYEADGISELITTRRLVHIIQAYTIFGQNKEKAIKLCLNRFDDDIKKAFIELYESVAEPDSNVTTSPDDAVAF